jgi:hypothetical protein
MDFLNSSLKRGKKRSIRFLTGSHAETGFGIRAKEAPDIFLKVAVTVLLALVLLQSYARN